MCSIPPPSVCESTMCGVLALVECISGRLFKIKTKRTKKRKENGHEGAGPQRAAPAPPVCFWFQIITCRGSGSGAGVCDVRCGVGSGSCQGAWWRVLGGREACGRPTDRPRGRCAEVGKVLSWRGSQHYLRSCWNGLELPSSLPQLFSFSELAVRGNVCEGFMCVHMTAGIS